MLSHGLFLVWLPYRSTSQIRLPPIPSMAGMLSLHRPDLPVHRLGAERDRPFIGLGRIGEAQGDRADRRAPPGTIVGRGVVYFIAIGSLLAVLCLSANTSFVDFPRPCRLVARDGYLPARLCRARAPTSALAQTDNTARRSILATIASADLVQTGGLGLRCAW